MQWHSNAAQSHSRLTNHVTGIQLFTALAHLREEKAREGENVVYSTDYFLMHMPVHITHRRIQCCGRKAIRGSAHCHRWTIESIKVYDCGCPSTPTRPIPLRSPHSFFFFYSQSSKHVSERKRHCSTGSFSKLKSFMFAGFARHLHLVEASGKLFS